MTYFILPLLTFKAVGKICAGSLRSCIGYGFRSTAPGGKVKSIAAFTFIVST